MNISDYIVYLWLIPVTLQIVVPLAMLAGWGVSWLVALFKPEFKADINSSPLWAGQR